MKSLRELLGYIYLISCKIDDSYSFILVEYVNLEEPMMQAINRGSVIQSLITTSSKSNPDKTAFQFEDGKSLTYKELEQRTNQLAHFLESVGVNRGHYIGILMDRNEYLVTGILGVLKASAAYVPLDPRNPSSRLKHMVEQSGITFILTYSHLYEKAVELRNEYGKQSIQLIVLDQDIDNPFTFSKRDLNKYPTSEIELKNEEQDIACVLFTSGSTGLPKGVLVHHQGIMNFIFRNREIFEFDENDRFIAVSSVCFDLFIAEVLMPLTFGATVYLVTSETVRDPWRLVPYLKENRITVWQSAPTIWVMWLNTIKKDPVPNLPDLRWIIVGGEKVLAEQARKSLSFFPNARIVEMYGATEASIWTTYRMISDVSQCMVEQLDVGVPMKNTSIVIMDEEMKECSVGEIGEICIGGVGVTHGYINDPEKSSQAFIDIMNGGRTERIYRTGDLGKLTSDGRLYFVGRRDLQVKINGNRIELEEIENVAIQIAGVKEAAVVVVEKQGKKELVCYLTKDTDNLSENDIREHFREKLVTYMIPHHICILEQMPVNVNGKIDRKFLSEYKLPHAEIKSSSSSVEIEPLITEVWKEVLGHQNFEPTDSFFNIGGDSVKTVTVKMMLDEHFPDILDVTDLFAYPSIRELSEYIESKVNQPKPSVSVSNHVTSEMNDISSQIQHTDLKNTNDIAIIGIGCRFPGGQSAEEFWYTLSNGIDTIEEVPADRWDWREYYSEDPYKLNKSNSKWGGFIKDIDQFDANFFGISRKEAELMDPQHRLILEVAQEALENAGYAGDQLNGTRTGVFLAGSMNEYLKPEMVNEAFVVVGNNTSMIPNRISFLFNLRGPSMYIDTACSASMVSVHEAIKSILHGESDLAIAGGVSLMLEPERYVSLSKMSILSAEGRCKVFDQDADGFVPGEGAGVVILKPLAKALEDGDHIHAVIKGSAVNHGGKAMGFTAPNPIAQQELIKEAIENAQVSPETISFIETHGTGTNLGDPIELKALKNVFHPYDLSKNSVAIGSVKSNIGHLGEAAGVASLIKVVLALKHKQIPPSIHFHTPNPKLGIEDSPFYVNQELVDWNPASHVRRAGISSFGMGGTNAHLILEEAPEVKKVRSKQADASPKLLAISAKTKTALKKRIEDLYYYLEKNPELSLTDVCYTANIGRAHFQHRLSLTVSSLEELVDRLKDLIEQPDFPSSEADYYNYTQEKECKNVLLYLGEDDDGLHAISRHFYQTNGDFRRLIHECQEYIDEPIAFLLGSPTAYLDEKLKFVIAYCLGKVFCSWTSVDIKGFGVGSIVAKCLLDQMTIQEALDVLSNEDTFNREASFEIEITQESNYMIVPIAVNQNQWDALNQVESTVVLSDKDSMLELAAQLYVYGARLNWDSLDPVEGKRRIELPLYPYERQRYWYENEQQEKMLQTKVVESSDHELTSKSTEPVTVVQKVMLSQEEIEEHLIFALRKVLKNDELELDAETDFFDIDLDSLSGVEVINYMSEITKVKIDPAFIFQYPTVHELAQYIYADLLNEK